MTAPQPARLTGGEVPLRATVAARLRMVIAARGEAYVAEWCAGLLDGSLRHDEPARPPLTWLGGGHAWGLLHRRGAGLASQAYWPRVWGARGLLYAWSPGAERAVLTGLADEAWRVREMAAKVARRRLLGDAEAELTGLLDDEVPRVRIAAARALARVGDLEAVEALDRPRADPEPRVRFAFARALEELGERLDRDR